MPSPPTASAQSPARWPANLESGQPLLLENLRFHPEEEANDPVFAKKLASLCDIYVNDAFGSAHRAHASTEGITHFVKQSAAGLLMEKELTYLGKALTDPDKPFVAIIGGAKVSDKISVIDNLLDKADAIIIGGGMAYTFLNAQGQSTGKSLVETDKIDVAKAALAKAKAKGVRFLLPIDHVLADKFAPNAKTHAFSGTGAFPADLMALDIGPKSIALFEDEIAEALTIIWNGPMGVFEMPAFANGTNAIAHAVARNHDATTIVGGGDSVAAVQQSGVADQHHPHLHRRRSQPRIPRRQNPPRRRGPHRQPEISLGANGDPTGAVDPHQHEAIHGNFSLPRAQLRRPLRQDHPGKSRPPRRASRWRPCSHRRRHPNPRCPVMTPGSKVCALGVFPAHLSIDQVNDMMLADPAVAAGRFTFEVVQALFPSLETVKVEY